MKSLGDIFRHLVHQDQAYDDAPQPAVYYLQRHHHDQHPEIMQVAQKPSQHHANASPAQATPSRQEVLNYLGQLADDYHVPRRAVYALAEAESHINPEIDPQPNYEKKHGKFVLDEQGNRKVASWDYGLLQINSKTIGNRVKDANGHTFHVEPTVKDKEDWKANASAGVAIFADAYHLAQLEQGPGTTEEDHAQQAYSQYNGGSPKTRERYQEKAWGSGTRCGPQLPGRLRAVETREEMKRPLCFVTLATISLATPALAAPRPQRASGQQITFEQTGYFYGEEQYYVVVPPIVHVYDAVWPEKPDTYRHEVFHIKNGKWVKTLSKPSSKPKLFLDDDLCDTDNHLDVPGGPLRNVLPPGVRIKDVEHHLDFAVAIYSDTPAQTEWYSLKAALLRRDRSAGWRVVNTIYAGRTRHYCGRAEFPVPTRPGEQSFVLLLYTSETNAEDRSFTDIQSFLVRKRPLENRP